MLAVNVLQVFLCVWVELTVFTEEAKTKSTAPYPLGGKKQT